MYPGPIVYLASSNLKAARKVLFYNSFNRLILSVEMTIAKKLAKGLAFVGLGSLISLISYLYTKKSVLPGAYNTDYGFPLSWFRKSEIVYPGRPVLYHLSLADLLVDIAFWALLTGALYEGYSWYKSRK